MGDGERGERKSNRKRASKRQKKRERKKKNTRERYKLYSEVIATHRCLSSQNEDYD